MHQYSSHPETRKEAYGAKAKDIADQYVKFVPPEFVPDRFSLPDRGRTGTLTRTTLSKQSMALAERRSTRTSGNAAGPRATPVGMEPMQNQGKVRWSAAVHAAPLASALLGPPFNGVLPKKLADWHTLASNMPTPGDGLVRDVQTLKETPRCWRRRVQTYLADFFFFFASL